jgi:hypothetical protein
VKLMLKNRAELAAILQKTATALERHCAEQTVMLDGKPTKPRAVIDKLRRHIAAWREAAAMHAKWLATTRKLRAELRADIVPTMYFIRAYAGSTFGRQSRIFTDFGFAPRKAWRSSVENKVAANAKRAATRKARGTMGKKQRRAARRAAAPASGAA